MSSISAGTSSGTALVQSGDTTGALVIKTGASAATAATFNADQTTTFAGAVTAPSFSGTSSTATNLAGGANGSIPYQSASGTTQMLAAGTAGQLLQTNGAGAPTWTTLTAAGINVQTFTSSGTWTKPSLAAGSRVLIQAWGGGGSGGKSSSFGAGGGGGGGYKERWVTLSAMGATETVTVGAGGASLSSNGFGNVGGSTTVGTFITAYGGGGGNQGVEGFCINITPGGGGAGLFGPGVTQSSGNITYWGNGGFPDGGGGAPRPNGSASQGYPRTVSPNDGLNSNNMSVDAFSDTAGAGGGGRAGFTNESGNTDRPTFNGGRAVWGGGGGGGTQGTTGGVSQHGGNGGAGGATGTVGTQPAGGGGGSSSGNSGAGGAGQVIITVFPA
jgi:hypothetical protein